MRLRLFSLAALALGALPFAGCDALADDEPAGPRVAGVVVANQGNFTPANGSLTAYDPETGTANAAARTDLASTLQGLLVRDGRLYVAADKAGRVDVLDARTLATVGQAAGLPSVRSFAVARGTLYATNLYGADFAGGYVTPIDLATNAKGTPIRVGDHPEGVAAVGDRVFVANHGFGAGTTVSVVDARTNTVVATYAAGCDGPRSLFADGPRALLVVCTGKTLYDADFNVVGGTNGAVVVLDPATGTVRATVGLGAPAGAAANGQDAFFSEATGELFVAAGAAVVRVRTDGPALAGEAARVAGGAVSAVAYDARRGDLYVGVLPAADPYTTSGRVEVFRRSGDAFAARTRFAAGIAPAFIAFTE